MKRSIASAAGLLLVIGSLFVAMGPAGGAVPGIEGKLIYSRNPGTTVDLYAVDPDGSNETPVAVRYVHPAWSPDGSTLAATAYGDGGPFLMNADGSNIRAASNEIGGDWPAWSPDGTRLAMRSESHVVILDLQDGSASQLRTPGLFISRDPTWSPDGRHLAFIGVYRDENDISHGELYVKDLWEGTITQLTDMEGFLPAHPTWSPDGTTIAFETINAPQPDILTIPAGGGAITNLTTAVNDSARSATWSPTGDRIAYLRGFSVWVMNTAGGAQQQLVPALSNYPLYEVAWQTLCTVVGTPGPDHLVGTAGDDRICGLGGADTIEGGGGDDALFGGNGADSIVGGSGADIAAGGPGSDEVSGTGGNDLLFSGLGKGLDVLLGGPGADRLSSRDRNKGDASTGGPGTDSCRVDKTDTKRSCP